MVEIGLLRRERPGGTTVPGGAVRLGDSTPGRPTEHGGPVVRRLGATGAAPVAGVEPVVFDAERVARRRRHGTTGDPSCNGSVPRPSRGVVRAREQPRGSASNATSPPYSAVVIAVEVVGDVVAVGRAAGTGSRGRQPQRGPTPRPAMYGKAGSGHRADRRCRHRCRRRTTGHRSGRRRRTATQWATSAVAHATPPTPARSPSTARGVGPFAGRRSRRPARTGTPDRLEVEVQRRRRGRPARRAQPIQSATLAPVGWCSSVSVVPSKPIGTRSVLCTMPLAPARIHHCSMSTRASASRRPSPAASRLKCVRADPAVAPGRARPPPGCRAARPCRAGDREAEDPEAPPCEGGLSAASTLRASLVADPSSHRLRASRKPLPVHASPKADAAPLSNASGSAPRGRDGEELGQSSEAVKDFFQIIATARTPSITELNRRRRRG